MSQQEKTPSAKIHEIKLGIGRLLWLFAVMSPAILLYCISLGVFKLDIRVRWNDPILELPGWFNHEISWYVTRAPF